MKTLGIYSQLYEFAASAGALEGYVYQKNKIDLEALSNWVDHLVTAYKLLDEKVRKEIQPSLNGTLGRAVQSFILILGENDETIIKLKSMIGKGPLPESPNDFNKKKWFEVK